MNIYEKIQMVKLQILHANLKKSGKNTFAGYSYYELADLLPTIIKLCNEAKLFTKVDFTDDLATLEVINIEKPDEKVIYTSPMKDLQLKGANAIQALGGVETYQRRYLYLTCFDIIESDAFDAMPPNSHIEVNANVDRLNKAIKKYAKNVGQDEGVVKKALFEKLGAKKVSDLTNEQIEKLIAKIS